MDKTSLPKLYLITDRKQCSNLEWTIQQSLEGGLRLVQLREKDLSSRELFGLALNLRKLTRKYNALLIINDRLDVALAVQADGIHVGNGSLPIYNLKNIMTQINRKILIGYSSHSLEEAEDIQNQGVDWITFSPIFETKSKSYGIPQGLTNLEEMTQHIKIPIYALGGVNQSNIPSLLNTKIHGVAMISEIITSQDPKQTTVNLLSLIDKYGN